MFQYLYDCGCNISRLLLAPSIELNNRIYLLFNREDLYCLYTLCIEFSSVFQREYAQYECQEVDFNYCHANLFKHFCKSDYDCGRKNANFTRKENG